jgi:hypothetical protein
MKNPLAVFSLGFYLPLSGFLEKSEVSFETQKTSRSSDGSLEDNKEVKELRQNSEPFCEKV